MDYGVPRQTTGAFLFSLKGSPSSPAAEQTTQFAGCSITKMSSGLYFVSSTTSLYWEHFFPTLAIRWYELLSRRLPITLDSLRNYSHDDIATTPKTVKLAAVGYPGRLESYYKKLKPSWKSLDCPIGDLQLLSMEFHRAREFSSKFGRAPLQFANYAVQHDALYSNQLLQAAASLALLLHYSYAYRPLGLYAVQGATMEIDLHSGPHSRRNKEATSPYVLTA
jgi:hypothetical protein